MDPIVCGIDAETFKHTAHMIIIAALTVMMVVVCVAFSLWLCAGSLAVVLNIFSPKETSNE